MQVNGGGEVDVTSGLDRAAKSKKILTEMVGQVRGLAESHSMTINAILERNFEVAVGFTVKLKKYGASHYKVETDISYTVEKIKDSVDAELNINQDKLFGERSNE